MTNKSLTEALHDVIRKLGSSEKYALIVCQNCWPDIVGRLNAEHSFPQRCADGVLTVNVDSPVWLQSLEMLKPQILARLNEKLDAGNIPRRVFFRIGPVPSVNRQTGKAEASRKRNKPSEPAEGIRRLRELQRQLIEKELADGMKPCMICGLPAGKEDLCPVCRVRVTQTAYQGACHLLRTCPWMSDAEILETIPELTLLDLKAARREIAAEFRRIIERSYKGGVKWREAALSLVMLKTGRRPEEISAGCIVGVLGQELAGYLKLEED